ncbi:NADH-ubiquinone oxidoreductase-F iron-sulfur binding region domain-containing protein [Sediminispirochaeta smaragdinae]|uniref:NADH dehydrogenase (Quinone) n=1 Tax=Sediminispirochaeta smaragdinae (strain DSM 11293 / JCM 15392 / SEBR 4228) TaxID=573413 RepID=E1RAY0_SEDSS|nr:NADH-ubiquinone oxidoreductase-F iron-sulfur binding region domain-containing protein [Sediminispirochaeta smaragdinae]ADK79510.1 NADH dehydrogenase (quinone) [Sediminispirochaeta smaragdinae DSM 11293]
MLKLNLEAVGTAYDHTVSSLRMRIIICAGTGCLAGGSLNIFHAFKAEAQKHGVPLHVELKQEDNPEFLLSKSGCQGFCQVGPLVTIEPAGILYTKVTAEDVPEIFETTILSGKTVERLLYVNPADGKRCSGPSDIPFYVRQSRSVLASCGLIDPENIREYIYGGGYRAAMEAYTAHTPEELCTIFTDSGLRGRGGGGFPSGKKWALTLRQQADKKYLICNGDEGDPGAFMDRSILEGNPHSVVEGMMIAARAIGAEAGYVYVRAEYPLAVERIRKAIDAARELGLLGEDLFGTGACFDIKVMEGAGAFVCGEASAMVASIMGGRGMPRPKPPRTAEKGLWDKPTVVNNVETLATVPLVLRKGSKGYRTVGTSGSPGTKTFALTGHVANTGLIEVPFGTTLREIIFEIGGGVLDEKGNVDNDAFKAVQIGGPSGGCLTREHLDIPLDFDSLGGIGAMVGSGGLVVMNRSTCMVQVARFFMQFTQAESCGKCVPCREGTRQMLDLLDDIIEGRADESTIPLLESLCRTVARGSLCGLGKAAPSPVLSTLRYFRQEYESHVVDKRCPVGACKALSDFVIDESLCKGCTACAKACPVGAISGEKKAPHTIDTERCIRCGACMATCRFGAIRRGGAA